MNTENSNKDKNADIQNSIENKKVDASIDALNENQNNINASSEEPRFNKKQLILGILSTIGIGIGAYGGHELGSQILEEQERLSELDKDSLDLQTIINTTDDIGDSTYQLNWKEVTSILGVEKNNYTVQINADDIKRTASLFIDEETQSVKDFDEVVDLLDLNNKKKERIYNYLEDLENYGYMPERLDPNSEQMQFINSIKEGAIESYKTSKILPSITIAQAILESNWGNSNLTKEANNLFGIKADYYWKGDFVTFETNEYHNTMITDKFRKYNSLDDSIKDHSDFLLKNQRYEEGGVFEAKTYKEQAKALESSGYSTAEDEFGNKTYAKMLEQIIRQYNLQIIDSKVINDN